MGLEGRQITDFQLKIRNPWRCKVWPNSEPIRHFSTRKPGEKPGKSGRKSKAALSKGLVLGACFHF